MNAPQAILACLAAILPACTANAVEIDDEGVSTEVHGDGETTSAEGTSVDDGADGGDGRPEPATDGFNTTVSDDGDDGPSSDTFVDTDWGWFTSSGSDGEPTAGSDPECVALDLGGAMGSEVFAGVLTNTDTTPTLQCNAAPGATPDVVFRWTPPMAGDYTIHVVSDAFDPVLAVRQDDCQASVFGCNDDCVGTAAAVVVSGWEAPIDIIVESANGAAGAFSLAIEFGASVACP